MNYLYLILVLCCTAKSIKAQREREVNINSDGAELSGTLLLAKSKSHLVIIHPGSGPTDRNGNQEGLQSNCYLKIAEYLFKHGYSSLRIDKRGIGKSDLGLESEAQLLFSHYVNDLYRWAKWATDSAGFKTVILLGHSEGALIALKCMNEHPELNHFISVSGAGRPADEILKEQLQVLPQKVKNLVFPMIDTLKTGKRISNVPVLFYALFRPDVQPYLCSWFLQDPVQLAKTITKKVLILQGDYDIQVTVSDAQNLHSAFPQSELHIIHGMNHVLTQSKTTLKTQQMADYNNTNQKLHKGFTKALLRYLKSINQGLLRS